MKKQNMQNGNITRASSSRWYDRKVINTNGIQEKKFSEAEHIWIPAVETYYVGRGDDKYEQNGNALHPSSLRAKRSNLVLGLPCRYAPRNDGASEKGNALWFILIAILLLGLLTSMMTRSGSSTNDTGSYEQLTIQANEILNYAKSIEIGVQSLLARGCSENEISFDQNIINGYSNPISPTNKSCHVFEPEGAGLNLPILNSNWLDQSENAQTGFGEPFFSQRMRISNVGKNCSPGTCQELSYFTPFIKYDVCLYINKQLGIGNTVEQDTNHAQSYVTNAKFDGVYNSNNLLNGTTLYNGKYAGCFQGDLSPPGGYHFYQVLIAR